MDKYQRLDHIMVQQVAARATLMKQAHLVHLYSVYYPKTDKGARIFERGQIISGYVSKFLVRAPPIHSVHILQNALNLWIATSCTLVLNRHPESARRHLNEAKERSEIIRKLFERVCLRVAERLKNELPRLRESDAPSLEE